MSDFRSEDLPEFQKWSRQFTPPLDTRDYTRHNVGVAAAVILSDLFFPQLIIVRGCLLLADQFDESNFNDWWESLDGNLVEIERVINHIHLWDVFSPADPVEERGLEVLAHRMGRMWRIHAAEQFPDRVVTVTVADDYGPTIILYSGPEQPAAGE